MVEAVDIQAALDTLTVFRGRRPDTPAEALSDTFATLARLGEGGVFVGGFQGDSAWERHTKGDELVHFLEGAATLTILTEAGERVLEMKAGMLTVVPRGCWHRFQAPEGVTVLTVTPQPTEHSVADPREAG